MVPAEKEQTHLASRLYHKPIAPSCAEVSALLWLGCLKTDCSAALDLQSSSPAAHYGTAHSSSTLKAPMDTQGAHFQGTTEHRRFPGFCGALEALIGELRSLLNSDSIGNSVKVTWRM